MEFQKKLLDSKKSVEKSKPIFLGSGKLVEWLININGVKSQGELSRRIGKHRSYINMIIKDRYDPPKRIKLKISQVLGVNPKLIWKRDIF